MSTPIIIDWKNLKKLGWPYSRTDTVRKMKAGKFPQSFKLADHRNSHPVWAYAQVVAHFQSRGLTIEDGAIPE